MGDLQNFLNDESKNDNEDTALLNLGDISDNLTSMDIDDKKWTEAMRSTAAHSTVNIDDVNSSDIFSDKALFLQDDILLLMRSRDLQTSAKYPSVNLQHPHLCSDSYRNKP